MADLHMWTFGDAEWVIALSKDDAVQVWLDFTGASPEEAKSDSELWKQLDDDELFKLWTDSEGKPCDPNERGATLLAKPAYYWVAKLGRCYVGSTEW